MPSVVVGSGELSDWNILIRGTACRVGIVGGHRGRSTAVVLGIVIEHGVVSWGKSAEAVRIIVISAIGVGIAVARVAAVAALVVATAVGTTRGLVIVHVNSLVSLVAVRSHGESSLVGVDVVGAHLAVVVAW